MDSILYSISSTALLIFDQFVISDIMNDSSNFHYICEFIFWFL